jgi:hypothetical protein
MSPAQFGSLSPTKPRSELSWSNSWGVKLDQTVKPTIKRKRNIMTFPRRRFLQLGAGVTASAAPRLASADNFPTRPIRLVLPFPPGGAFDIIGRPWADKVSRTLGTVIVENKPGAGGSVAAAAVAHSQPDGYTIFLGSSSIHLADMILRSQPLYDPMRDLATVSMLAMAASAIDVHPSSCTKPERAYRLCEGKSGQAHLWVTRRRDIAAS